jgi:hypothetical protein
MDLILEFRQLHLIKIELRSLLLQVKVHRRKYLTSFYTFHRGPMQGLKFQFHQVFVHKII